tara:strand:- start:136 stop:351 length:216 start_codon:yes stop_codon:yes gene_type:complete
MNGITHDIITNCDCQAHLLRITKFDDEESISITHYSCSPEEVDDSKNLCWDVILNKEKAINLAESIFQIYS